MEKHYRFTESYKNIIDSSKSNFTSIHKILELPEIEKSDNEENNLKLRIRYNRSNMIVVDIHGSFNDNVFYTQDTIIHEMGHKFDDMMYETNIIEKLFGKPSYTNNNNEWSKCYNKYNKR